MNQKPLGGKKNKNKMLRDYLKIVRWPNLVVMALVQIVMYECVLKAILSRYNQVPALSGLDLLYLVIATVFIAAGGYLVNDYFDMKIDEINKPITRIVGKTILRKDVMFLYKIVTAIGLVAGFILSYRVRSITCATYFIFLGGLLWFFSSSYKRMFIVGNFICALVMALVPFFIALFNNQMLDVKYNPTPELFFIKNEVYSYLGAYSIYTFLWIFAIDIVNDLITQRGDREMECHTFPVVIGERNTKILIGVFLVLLNGVLSYMLYADSYLNNESATWRYFVCGSVIPSLSMFYFLAKSKTVPDYILLKKYMTVIFLIGFAFSFWIRYAIGFRLL